LVHELELFHLQIGLFFLPLLALGADEFFGLQRNVGGVQVVVGFPRVTQRLLLGVQFGGQGLALFF